MKATADKTYELHGERIFECAAEGVQLRGDRDAVEIIGAALGHGARLIAIPTERLGIDFFRLKTGVAGAMLQKFVTYGIRVAIVGDISEHMKESSALRDFVYESNRGSHGWFVANVEELEQRLRGGGGM